MMDGVELQLRGQQHIPNTTVTSYPQSHDRRLQVGDHFRESKEQLESKLATIDRFYASPEAGPHEGPPNCHRCSKKKHDIAQAFYDYYLSKDSRAWYAGNAYYTQEMQRRFESPDVYSLDDIHSFFQSVLREHLKQDLCTVLPTDDSKTTDFKYKTSEFFNEGHRATNEILDAYLDHVSTIAPNPDAAIASSRLQDTWNTESRARLYTAYYCSPIGPNEPPAAKAIKAKHARMFEALVPHDEVLASWRKDAEDSQAAKISELQGKLSDIKMAQSAYLKNKKKKAEKDQRMLDREPTPRIEQCALGGCPIEINLVMEEVIECAICEWMDRKGGERGRAVYCSMEHANEDFEEHDAHDHRCMAEKCIYYPKLGPPGNFTSSLCACQCCLEEDLLSVYCSRECYEENFAEHQEQAYQRRGNHNHYEELEYFRPAEEMQIIS
ncbi:hypothetical protein ONS95_002784 [Cadophora gregata]|uniref:uncharacterized protein n=1 Tax=Cadophora gregata TaxID=51156 RepID=UPI0026DDCA8C|nr:uncharacterized protein ONS95_002784 [Cadophora gregata]KAK0110131.1 hypothetical protein ONS95_002784 [Cadophora gregata]KAK0110253.1 hypothetical protein ONS96_001875 [Cadophora gregata f. sp. sojae]